MKRSTIITLGIAAGFTAILLYSTLSAQAVECHTCVRFNGVENCAKASGKDTTEALRTAVNTACGTISQGMAESIQCAGMPPLRPQCTTN